MVALDRPVILMSEAVDGKQNRSLLANVERIAYSALASIDSVALVIMEAATIPNLLVMSMNSSRDQIVGTNGLADFFELLQIQIRFVIKKRSKPSKVLKQEMVFT